MRTAFVGLGWWGMELALAAERTKGRVSVAAGCALEVDSRADFETRFICPTYPDFAEMLTQPSIEAVVLATPHSLHASQAIAAARAGKHVMVEKPLALGTENAARIVSSCTESGVTLAVGHNRRLLPQVDRLAELLRNAALGNVLHVEANFSTPEALGLPAGHWRTLPGECPGGAMTVLGCHVIDWLHHLLGPVTEVSARFASRSVSHGGDDTAFAWLTMRSGVTVTLVTLYAAPYVNRFAIHGSEASVLVEATGPETTTCRPYFKITRRTGQSSVESLPYVDTLSRQLELWADACAGRGSPAVGGAEAARNVAVLDAMIRSAERGGTPIAANYGPFRV